MILIGYFAIILMGLSLGIIGAGGSILTMPILIYCFKIDPIAATTYSLLIVGLTAFFGAAIYFRKKMVVLKSALSFIIPSTLAVILVRKNLIPILGKDIFGISKDSFFLILLSILMIIAAILTNYSSSKKTVSASIPDLNSKKISKSQNSHGKFFNFLQLILGSGLVGILTGLVGVGGGFLIVPTLILLFRLDVQKAVGTSLTIIAINALSGFKSDLVSGVKIHWLFLLELSALTIFGMFVGIKFGKKMDGKKLKKIFSIIVILIAILIFFSTLKPGLSYENSAFFR